MSKNLNLTGKVYLWELFIWPSAHNGDAQ